MKNKKMYLFVAAAIIAIIFVFVWQNSNNKKSPIEDNVSYILVNEFDYSFDDILKERLFYSLIDSSKKQENTSEDGLGVEFFVLDEDKLYVNLVNHPKKEMSGGGIEGLSYGYLDLNEKKYVEIEDISNKLLFVNNLYANNEKLFINMTNFQKSCGVDLIYKDIDGAEVVEACLLAKHNSLAQINNNVYYVDHKSKELKVFNFDTKEIKIISSFDNENIMLNTFNNKVVCFVKGQENNTISVIDEKGNKQDFNTKHIINGAIDYDNYLVVNYLDENNVIQFGILDKKTDEIKNIDDHSYIGATDNNHIYLLSSQKTNKTLSKIVLSEDGEYIVVENGNIKENNKDRNIKNVYYQKNKLYVVSTPKDGNGANIYHIEIYDVVANN